jgi:chitinase
MFGGGTHQYRPFGDSVIDGIDLDIEGGPSTGYAVSKSYDEPI